MRPWSSTTQVILSITLLGFLAGCGGGGGSSSGGGLPTTGTPPVTSFTGVTGSPASLTEYQTYTFSASSTDTTIGRNVAHFLWNFGDGSAVQTIAATAGACTVNYAYKSSGTFNGTVQAVDNVGLAGNSAAFSETVNSAPSPVTLSFTSPSTTESRSVVSGGSITLTFTVSATTTSGGTINASGLSFNAGDTNGPASLAPAPMVESWTANGGGSFSIVVTYYAAGSQSARVISPTASATDTNLDSSPVVSCPTITLTTIGATTIPQVVVTNPPTKSTAGFTSKPVSLGFQITDQDNDVVTYSVAWGDGSAPTTGSTAGLGNTSAGVTISLAHTYSDAFAYAPNPSPNTATATVTISDGVTPQGEIQPATCTYAITYNTYPTATILTPQASGTLPTTTQLPNLSLPGLYNPPIPNVSPELVVIPNGGQLSFNGTGTLPGSGDTPLTYTWTFPNGAPANAYSANAGQVVFFGTPGQLTPCLVTFTVTDPFGRVSSNGPNANVSTYQKWVIVDGTNTQDFNLTFLYRQKSDNNGLATLVPVQTGPNGLGAGVQIFQDGITSSWAVQSGNQATISIPVRSNLPFYALIPSFGNDAISYMLQIPNAPSGAYEDPSLSAGSVTPLPANTEGFGFQSSTPPWGPTLQVVTAQGFAPETSSAAERILIGDVAIVIGETPLNSRWVDRLSVPGTDPMAVQWEQDSNNVGAINSEVAYQSFAEWPTVPTTVAANSYDATDTNSTTQGKPGTMGFNVAFSTYGNSLSQNSQTFLAEYLQTYRVPAGSTDPYNLSNIGGAGWGRASCLATLTPTALSYTGGVPNYQVASFYYNMLYGDTGASPLGGGLQNFGVPYDPNDPNRTPSAPVLRPFDGEWKIFTYAEYLWSSVWIRPLVLNTAELNHADTFGILNAFPWFRYSQPASWPSFTAGTGIVPDGSYFDLTVAGGPTFDASSPVWFYPNSAPSSPMHAVGRFYWTAFTPSYNADSGALISRTWLADDTGGTVPVGQPPITFSGQNSGDATAALGLVPPQDTMVDKRGRNADGSLNGSSLGGYRVTWYNPTVDHDGVPVPPDFWVVELVTSASEALPSGGKVHFMLPASFPVTQTTSALLLTDAQTFLPSGSHTLVPGDTVAPGYCWFDIPPELRPSTGTTATITVFALKSILRNHPVAAARALNRPDWVDGVKTGSARVSTVPSSLIDISYAHKIPFNYPWDIVVVNGPATLVEP